MRWKPERAAEWMRQTALDLGSDFMEMPYEEGGGMGEPLRASAGALFFGIYIGVPTETEADFRKWMTEQVGWDDDAVHGALEEIMPMCQNTNHAHNEKQYGAAETYFTCHECRRTVCTHCEGSTNNMELCDECWIPEEKRA